MQFPSSSQPRFLNTTTSPGFSILSTSDLPKTHSGLTTSANGCPPNLTPPWRCHVDLFWCPRSVAPSPGKIAKVGGPERWIFRFPRLTYGYLWLWWEGWEAAIRILVPWKMSDFLFVFLMAWPMAYEGKGKAATKYEGSVKFRGSMCFFQGCC